MTKLTSQLLLIYSKRLPVALLFLFACTSTLHAQEDSVQNLYFSKKTGEPAFGDKDYMPYARSFYIYRNCVYTFVLKKSITIRARVADIRNDSIYYTYYFGGTVYPGEIDTFSLHPSRIKGIKTNNNQVLNFGADYSLFERKYVFEKSVRAKAFSKIMDTIYGKDSNSYSYYELVPQLTDHGIDRLYLQHGQTPGYEVMKKSMDTAKKIWTPVVKNWVWFTPSRATKINGLNIGLQTNPFNDKELEINGVNLNADAASALMAFYALMYLGEGNKLADMPDTISTHASTLSGLSLSAGGVIGDVKMHGVSLNGGIYQSVSSKGLVVTGSQSIVDEFNGVLISGLRNKSIKGKGLQVSLLNVCKHMKGIQIGLWNVNSKRKLPLINWSFRS
jgi:hypothetical protein